MIEEQDQTANPNPEGSLDEDGFLKTMSRWNRSTAQTLAELNDIGPLTDNHWKIIEFVKAYYEEHATGPPVVRICKETRVNRAEVCRLFPCGVARGAYRLAGLPRPSGCL